MVATIDGGNMVVFLRVVVALVPSFVEGDVVMVVVCDRWKFMTVTSMGTLIGGGMLVAV